MHSTDFKRTELGRFAFCFLDQPRTKNMQGQTVEPKYETVFYLPKTSADPQQCRNYAILYALVAEVLQNDFRGTWPTIRNNQWVNWPIHDCDVEEDLSKYPWARGNWKIRCSGGKFPPRVVDQGNNDIPKQIDGKFYPGTFKSGDYGYASINAYGYDNVNKGVAFGLEGVKKAQDGEEIGGGQRSVEDMFGAPTGQPMYHAGPQQPQGGPPAPMLPNGPAGPAAPSVYGGAPPMTLPPSAPPAIQPGYPPSVPPAATQGGYASYSPPSGAMPPPPPIGGR